jgi:hypothetical protein
MLPRAGNKKQADPAQAEINRCFKSRNSGNFVTVDTGALMMEQHDAAPHAG